MTDEERHLEICEIRIEVMKILLNAGWDPKRAAIAMGMGQSWAIAERWMAASKVAAE
jgi:hypothetical protein